MNKGTIDSLVDLLLLSKAMGDFLREVQTEVTNGLTLEDLLRLVELLPHQGIKVIIEYEILKLGQLLGEQLLLNLV